MTKLFILVKRKNSNKLLGAIPIKTGVTRTKASSVLKKQLRPGFSAKIITEAELKAIIKPRLQKVKRNTTKIRTRAVKRKTVKRRRKR